MREHRTAWEIPPVDAHNTEFQANQQVVGTLRGTLRGFDQLPHGDTRQLILGDYDGFRRASKFSVGNRADSQTALAGPGVGQTEPICKSGPLNTW